MTGKQSIRKEILTKRESMDKDFRKQASFRICTRFCESEWYLQADILLAYIGYKSEVDTERILQFAWEQGKEVYCPKVLSSSEEFSLIEGSAPVMEFYKTEHFAQVQEGYKGIPEPVGEDSKRFCIEQLNQMNGTRNILLLIPGVAFDRSGNRIGYGKGFYDTYIEKLEQDIRKKSVAGLNLYKAALAFEGQMVEEIPSDVHDRKVQAVFTEKNTIWC